MQEQSREFYSALNEEFGIIIDRQHLSDLSEMLPEILRSLIDRHGAVLFRDFDIQDHDFEKLAMNVGGNFVSHGAPSRPSVSDDGMLHLANPGTAALNLHTELGYFPLPPDYLWFHCIRPATAEGGTQICDGRVIAEKLSSKFCTLFAERKLRYSAFWPKDQWSRYFQTSSKNKVTSDLNRVPGVTFRFTGDRLILDYVVDAFYRPRNDQAIFANSMLHYCLDGFAEYLTLDDGSAVPGWAVLEAQSVSNAHMQEISWRKNDLLVLDNRRVMHGRKSHSDPERRLTVRMQRIN